MKLEEKKILVSLLLRNIQQQKKKNASISWLILQEPYEIIKRLIKGKREKHLKNYLIIEIKLRFCKLQHDQNMRIKTSIFKINK